MGNLLGNLCGSTAGRSSGRITYSHNEGYATTTQPAGHTPQDAGQPDHTDSRLSGLSSLNRSRHAAGSTSRQSSSSLAAVAQVLREVRENYYKPHLNQTRFKSSNKKKGDKKKGEESQEATRIYQATCEIARMRAQVDSLEEDCLTVAQEGMAHNCSELAVLAVYNLQDRNLPAHIASMAGRTHTAAIIGPVEGKNEMPSDMTQWHPDIYVCDPWSNIACRANDYPAAFRQRMEKWEADGKKVWLSGTGFVPPTTPQWMNSILYGEKKTL
jgi:hypothetical protein